MQLARTSSFGTILSLAAQCTGIDKILSLAAFKEVLDIIDCGREINRSTDVSQKFCT